MKHMRKTVTVGGSSLGNRSKLSVLAIALTLALTALVAVPAYAANGDATEPTLWDSIVSFFTGEPADGSVETYAVGDVVENSAVADRDSTNDWNNVLEKDGQVSTQNIGRIWTDKSVFTDSYTFQGSIEDTITKAEGSDFLVGLSALSSTSNLKTVTTTTTPLDIVLVLDVSGSMDDEMGQVYTPAYNPNRYGTYYIQNDNGGYTQLSYSSGGWGQQQGWYYTTGGGWDSQRHYVTPKSSATDSNPDHVQFYTAQSVSKMDSLKSAAGGFIDSVNTMNAALPEGSEQHRIAIVKFASNSSNNIGDDMYEVPGSNPRYQNRTQIVSDFSTNAIALDNAVNALDPAGATRADLGLEQAARVLNGGDNLSGAREGAKKVVIFFTDGNPTSGSSWEDSVASAAVDNAYQLKNTNGATVYSIGVVSGANPDSDPTSDNTSNINKFLHAVSSNYKNATYQYESDGWRGSYQWSLGDRTPAPEGSTETPQYYYAAEDSAQLDQVFQDITTSIGQDNASGSPIEDTTVEGETNPGNLTFNDELGAYMEVAGDTMQIVYADQTFTSGSRTSQNIEGGVVYTYPFSGTVHANEAYGDRVANLSGLQIKVTHYDDPAKGDLVEAVIPADLIPMRNYDVDTENGTMTVSSTYPVRLFYSVQVKTEAAQQLADPSSAIYTSNYVANNTNEDGTGVEFYSNLYTNSNGDGFVGDTTATFKPSNGNRFYYFTANTPLYTSNDGSDTQADRSFINGDNTVYYKDTYWVQTGGTVEDPETGEQIPAAEEKTEYVALSTSDIRNSVRYQNQYGSGAYLPAQTHNEDKIAGLYAAKGDSGNPTETAGDTLNPAWAGENISARMGNNGRLALELPGTLAVSKNVTFGGQYGNTGFDATDYTQDKSYDINITLTGEGDQPSPVTYKAQVKNAQGAVVSNPTDGYFDITFTDGKATQSIKHGETLYVYGLNAGATYEVTETAPGDGFTTAYDDNAKGTIEINKTSSTTVTNTYTLQSTELAGSTDLKVSKTLSNRNWREDDSFTFQIAAGQSTPNAPMPEKTTVTIDSTNKDDGASFGNITYSTPGQYVYIISEVVPTEDALTGVTYSRARYRVVVDVEDNGKGAMTATSTMTQIMDDAGANIENGAAIDTHTAAFTNIYRTGDQGGTANLGGTKRFTDATGATRLADWTFDFTLTAVGGYPSDNKPGDPDDEATVYPILAADVPMPADVQGTSKTVTLSGGAEVFNFGEMTYDGNDVGNTYVYAITEVAGDNDNMAYDGDTEYVTVTVTEAQDGEVAVINAVADRAAANVVFENSYAPESAKLTGDTALGGSKTITGRDMLEGESYDFTLEYVGGADGTTPAEEGWIELPVDDDMTASVIDADKGVETVFNFGDITFNHVGEYTFTISENVPTGEDALGGMTYDGHTCTVTVDVTYNKDEGRLDASVDYGAFGDRAGNEFVNEYKSSFNYGTSSAGGLNVSKTLAGRDMLDGEFSFTITAANVEGNPALTDNKLAEADENFSNGGANDGVANVMSKLRGIKFDQDDAGKTFIYTVAETKGDLANVDYDANVYTVEIKVVDDNDGTMHTETTVKNADGEQVGEVATWDDQATEGSTVATVAFKNTYTPDEAELTEGTDTGLKVTKKVTGAPTDADFNFTLVLTGQPEGSKVGGVTEDGEGNMIATTKVDHNFTADEVAAGTTAEAFFGTLTFDKAGTYTFDVIENEAQGEGADENWPAGWTYDNSTRRYTVVVTDENPAHATDESQPLYDGKLYIESVSPSNRNQTFTNSYDHGTVTIGGSADEALTVEKTVKGRSTEADFNFTFVPVEEEGVDWSTVEYEKGTADKTAVTDDFADGDKHDAKFGEITFTEPGIYKFNVTEDEAETTAPSGWEYDDSTKTITVTVKETDNAGNYDGKLHATVDGPATFENIYQLTPGKFRAAFFQLQGNKVLKGRNWEAGDEFTFTLTAGEGENVDGTKMAEGEVLATMPAKTTDTIKPMEDDSKVTDNSAQFTFTSNRIPGGSTVEEDTFTYTKPGTYRYLIRETNPNVATAGSGILGVSYDQTVYRLTVVVTDKGDGTLDAKGTYTKQEANGEWTELGGSDQITFTNTYSSDKVNITFNAFKVLQNRDTAMKDNEFMFHMEFAGWKANDDQSDNWSMDGEVAEKAPAPADDKGNIIRGDVTFAGMDFTADQVGYTYRYAITEVNGGQTINGVALDASTHYVTAKVTSVQQENEDGTFTEHVRVETSGEAEYDEQNQAAPTTGAVFTNTYDPGETTVDTGNADFDLTKILKGKDWNGDKFTFTISPVSAMNGDQEIIAADSPDFPMPAETTLTVDTATGEDKDGNDLAVFSFGDITYDQEGVYTYKVAEKTPVEGEDGYNAGITYSKNEATVVVTVTDNNEGGYTTVVNISNNEFVNEYHAKAEYNAGGVGGLDITKQLNNRAMANDQFTFTIEATGSNVADAAAKLGITEGTTTQVKSAQGDAGQAVSVASNPFDTVVFDEGDDGVTFTYTIKEEGTSGQGDYAGYTLDSSTYTVTITPKDNGDGTMTVTTAVVDSDGAHNTDACDNARVTVPFENTYEADSVTIGAQGDATIVAKKTLNNDDIASYTGVNAFKFQVLSGNTMISEGANDGTGAITFDTIEYTTENLAAAANGGSDEVGAATLDASGDEDVYTFIYTVAEVTDGLVDVGISPNIDSATVTVTVTDNRHGKLSIEVGYENGATGIEFENTYGADAEFDLTISGNKKITGEAGLNVPTLEDDDFTFKITGLPADDGTPAPMPVTDTATNKSGSVSFGPIAYTMENVFGTEDADASVNAEDVIEVLTAGRAKTFTYEITEIAGDVAGVDNDTTTKTVKVTVTDESEGKITAEVSAVDPGADAGNDFTFNNVYSVDPETSSLTGDGGFTIIKDFSSTNTDRTLAEGDFTFELKGKDGSVVRSAKNAADGTVSFEGITFTKPGTYEYTLSELNEGKPGVIYDNAIYNVTATAEDQGDGTLEVTWGMPQATNNGVTFSNTYTAATGSITLKAAKVLQGRNLADGEFTFELRENGKVIDTATNNAVGEVVFSTIEYAEPGEHDYEIVEVAGSAEGVTYDTTVHTMHVSVTDNTQTGALAVAWAYGENGAPVFRNTYTEPVEPAKPTTPAEPPAETIPRAGDATNTVLPAVIAASGITLAVAGSLVIARRRNK